MPAYRTENCRYNQFKLKEMKKSHYFYMPILAMLGFAVVVTSSSCSKDDETAPDETDKLLITTSQSIENLYSVELYAEDSLFEGYNQLYLRITRTSDAQTLTNAEIHLFPLMDMITMQHSAPVEQPASVANEEQFFKGAIVFLMPSTPDMGWTVEVAITDGVLSDTAILVIPKVKSLEEARKINVISQLDDTKYFVSLIQPESPIVGMNTFEIAIHYKENMMSFPAATDLTVEIEPEMPSMDHGSPNNENPVHIADGHYTGKVNFTMTGWWRVHLKLGKNNDVLTEEDVYFDITF